MPKNHNKHKIDKRVVHKYSKEQIFSHSLRNKSIDPDINKLKQFKKYLPLIVIISLSIAAWLFNLTSYFNLEAFKEHQKLLELYIEQNLPLSIIIYCLIYILIVSLTIPLATIMTLIGGFLLGQWIGTLTAVISATIGACIIFMSTKMASKDFLSLKASTGIKKFQKRFQENAFICLVTLRLIPFIPFVVINISSAFFQIPLRIFFFGTLLGIIPITFIYSSLGVALREVIYQPDFTLNMMLKPKILLELAALSSLSLLPLIFKYFRNKGL